MSHTIKNQLLTRWLNKQAAQRRTSPTRMVTFAHEEADSLNGAVVLDSADYPLPAGDDAKRFEDVSPAMAWSVSELPDITSNLQDLSRKLHHFVNQGAADKELLSANLKDGRPARQLEQALLALDFNLETAQRTLDVINSLLIDLRQREMALARLKYWNSFTPSHARFLCILQ